jgi:WD40 repeat protein
VNEHQARGAIVPLQPQGPLDHRSRLVSRGRDLALDLMRPTRLVTHWSDLRIRLIRWAVASRGRWEFAICGIVEHQNDWALVRGSPDRHTLRSGSWMRGNVESSPFESCAALSCGSLLAVATEFSHPENLLAIVPLAQVQSGGLDLKVILRTSYADPVRCLDFSPDGSRLVAGTLNGTVRVLDVSTQSELVCIGSATGGPRGRSDYANAVRYLPNDGHGKRVNAVLYHPTRPAVLSGSRDETASLWDDTTGHELMRYDHGADIGSVAFTIDGAIMLTAGTDSLIRCWDVLGGKEVMRIPCASSVRALVVSPLNRWVVWGGNSGEVGVWDLERSRECGRITLEDDQVVAVRFLDPNRFVALYSSGALLRARIRAG